MPGTVPGAEKGSVTAGGKEDRAETSRRDKESGRGRWADLSGHPRGWQLEEYNGGLGKGRDGGRGGGGRGPGQWARAGKAEAARITAFPCGAS